MQEKRQKELLFTRNLQTIEILNDTKLCMTEDLAHKGLSIGRDSDCNISLATGSYLVIYTASICLDVPAVDYVATEVIGYLTVAGQKIGGSEVYTRLLPAQTDTIHGLVSIDIVEEGMMEWHIATEGVMRCWDMYLSIVRVN